MKRSSKFAVLIPIFILVTACSTTNRSGPVKIEQYSGDIRVACVGNSITYGSGIENREENSYPAQLDEMLGSKWDVRNFGVSGATMLKSGDTPYWEQPEFQQALDFNPDVVIIKLGTNDSKPINWANRDEFIPDYRDMIQRFKDLPSNPRLWACYPVPAFEVRWGIENHVITGEVIPRIRNAARAEGVPIINLYALMENQGKFFPDKIHPDVEGARKMAKQIYETLTGETYAAEDKVQSAQALVW